MRTFDLKFEFYVCAKKRPSEMAGQFDRYVCSDHIYSSDLLWKKKIYVPHEQIFHTSVVIYFHCQKEKRPNPACIYPELSYKIISKLILLKIIHTYYSLLLIVITYYGY